LISEGGDAELVLLFHTPDTPDPLEQSSEERGVRSEERGSRHNRTAPSIDLS